MNNKRCFITAQGDYFCKKLNNPETFIQDPTIQKRIDIINEEIIKLQNNRRDLIKRDMKDKAIIVHERIEQLQIEKKRLEDM